MRYGVDILQGPCLVGLSASYMTQSPGSMQSIIQGQGCRSGSRGSSGVKDVGLGSRGSARVKD
eukprot:37151-Rhodomonas_salina.1